MVGIAKLFKTFSVFSRKAASFSGMSVSAPSVDFPRNPYFHVLAPFRTAPNGDKRPRINLLLPSVQKKHLTGGPATLINYVMAIREEYPDFALRLLPVMVPFSGQRDLLPDRLKNFDITKLCDSPPSADDIADSEIVMDAAHRSGILPITQNDVFIASMWPTHHVAKKLQKNQQEYFGRSHKIQYIIQDYECSALFPWSDLFLLAEQTYHDTENTIAVVGTASLKDYLKEMGHDYRSIYWFDPGQNIVISPLPPETQKENIILIYGRPDTPRNCFPLIFEALIKLTAEHPSITKNYQFISVGEKHPDYNLSHGAVLRSQGFMSPDNYKALLRKAAVGCFMVVSPHSGYVAMEMAQMGMLAITSSFRTKRVKGLHPNIREPASMDVEGVANAFLHAVQEFMRDNRCGLDTAIEYRATNKKPTAEKTFHFIRDLFSENYDFGTGD